jgi:transposase-like protein
MAERHLSVDSVTIWRWVQRYAPELERHCRRELRMTNRSWRTDETYIRVAGRWTYLYRAVDSQGNPIGIVKLTPCSLSREPVIVEVFEGESALT